MNGGTTLHPKLCARLAALVLSSRCLLVVSSSWRKEPEYMSAFLSKIQSLNVTAPFLAGQTGVIDHVPIMGMMRQLGMFVGDARRDALTCARIQRAQEIQAYLREKDPGHARRWVIVDDLDIGQVSSVAGLEDLELGRTFVKVDPDAGLTEANVEAVRGVMERG
ncbi:hypothetical protein TeGR_g2463 [Tetraparma gracilis]|uniref:Uncharacterized protein n=1 Tax=Tetraparma gracilis TaxID=2962635 RepID=A0ABQ6MMC5_9STRA|nr:hypothetical protein TeGR_g2463 [Tetraparma gracilis]